MAEDGAGTARGWGKNYVSVEKMAQDILPVSGEGIHLFKVLCDWLLGKSLSL